MNPASLSALPPPQLSDGYASVPRLILLFYVTLSRNPRPVRRHSPSLHIHWFVRISFRISSPTPNRSAAVTDTSALVRQCRSRSRVSQRRFRFFISHLPLSLVCALFASLLFYWFHLSRAVSSRRSVIPHWYLLSPCVSLSVSLSVSVRVSLHCYYYCYCYCCPSLVPCRSPPPSHRSYWVGASVVRRVGVITDRLSLVVEFLLSFVVCRWSTVLWEVVWSG